MIVYLFLIALCSVRIYLFNAILATGMIFVKEKGAQEYTAYKKIAEERHPAGAASHAAE